MDSSRSSIRIQHTQHAALGKAGSNSPAAESRSPRFPKLDECAHFHYEHVELGALQVSLISDQDLSLGSRMHAEDAENHSYTIQVSSQGKSWLLRRTYQNFRSLDTQLHRCIYDRKFSALPELPPEDNLVTPQGQDTEEAIQNLLGDYLNRFSSIAGNLINCGPVLSWLELDNRGRRLLVPDNDNCPINTPAVAAAYSVKRYSAQAQDEISFEVGDMISVIDMPPPEESAWWRGKRGFEVGFFPSDCVAVIGDKVPRNLQFSAGTSAPNSPRDMMLVNQPSKPVLRKHGKLIAFFRSFILSRPSRRRLKQSGILKERVFGCDLGEHLLNSGHDIPMVLKCCAEFIETNGIVDGIYRLSGVTSNIQKLRNAFDEDRVPGLYEDEAILQDIHSVASLLKMYFRELPNPLCTYQLYHQFVGAVQSKDSRDGPDENRDSTRLMLMRDAVQKLPPPHYRTLQYLIKHLARVAEHGHQTGMTPRNVAIVWAPNLLRCKALEVGGVAALQGVGVQAVVTEFLICYADLIFCDRLPALSLPLQQATPKRCRPKSLAISTPTKLLSLEEARTRALLSAAGKTDQEYIEVGGGPSSLPAKYHTVIDLPSRKRSGSKRSPLGWKSFFSKAGRSSGGSGSHSSRKVQQQQVQPQRKTSTPSEINFCTEKPVTESDVAPGRRRLRPVKSAESLASGNNSSRNSAALSHGSDAVAANGLGLGSQPSSQAVSPSDVTAQPGSKAGHNRSVSHDSYFDHLAETPLLSRQASSRLHEEEEGFSSSLDLSEIQLNFDLEESEMRIFSEDETLLSTFDSTSILSQGSPHTSQASHAARDRPARNTLVVGKRLPPQGPPHLARPEDSLSGGCASLDPSPKKQKTSASTLVGSGGGGNTTVRVTTDSCKRSRLEEQLTTSAAELRYIDSQSPEQQSSQQQVLVQAEIHQPNSNANNATSSSTSSNGTYTTLVSTSPSPAEAPVSDNESTTLLSSGLTTPDTPLLLYCPLREDGESSGSGIGSTPDYENMSLSASKLSPLEPRYEQLVAQSQTPSPSHECNSVPVPKPRFQGQRTPYENIHRDFLAAEISASQCNKSDLQSQSSASAPYENLRREYMMASSSPSPALTPPLSASVSPSLSAGTTAVRHLESSGEDDTLEASQDNFSLDLNTGFDHIYTEIMSAGVEESEGCGMSTESCDVEEGSSDYDCLSEVNVSKPVTSVQETGDEQMTSPSESTQNVYQNIPNPTMKEIIKKPEDDVYEDFAFEKSDAASSKTENTSNNTSSLDSNTIIYQQVKYLRRSVHEVNALLEEGELLAQVEAHAHANQHSNEQGPNQGDRVSDPVIEPEKHVSDELTDQNDPSLETCEPCPETHFDRAYEETSLSHDKMIDTVLPNEPECLSEDHYGQVCEQPNEPATLIQCDFTHASEPAQGSEYPVHFEKLQSPEGAALSSSFSDEQSLSEISDGSATTITKSVHDSRRKFESEIGRELVRERRMTQELEEVRTASNTPHESPLHKRSERNNDRNKSSVRELLSRFETTPMESEIPSHATTLSSPSPLPSRRSDPHPVSSEKSEMSSATLPPCLRARAARIARTKLSSVTSLSASLDEDHFLRSGGTPGEGHALIRTQTEPDVHTKKNSTGEHQDDESHQDSHSCATDNTCMMLSQDDDPQRRERIERYKEERRSFLRKKYRSESFRNEQDDTLVRLKQKVVGKAGTNIMPVPDSLEDVPMEDDRLKEQKPNAESSSSDNSLLASKSMSGSPTKSPSKTRNGKNSLSPSSPEPITCVTVRQRILTPDKVSLKGCELPLSPKASKADGQRFGYSPEKTSPEKMSPERRFAERTRIPMSVDLAQAERRPAQLVLVQRSSLPVASSDRRLSSNNKRSSIDSATTVSRNQAGEIRRRASSESSSIHRSPTKSPSYCIRDMAALFEAKESGHTASTANATNTGPNSTSTGGKQYLSSV